MAKDATDVLGTAIGQIAREAANSLSANNNRGPVSSAVGALSDRAKNLSGSKGLAAGVGMATVVPLAAKGVGKVVRGIGGGDSSAKQQQKKKKKGSSKGVEGVGKGRRMPIQQDIDIGAPIDMVYEHWTKYEE